MMKNSFEQGMLDQIIDYGKYPNLADIGSNDQEGYQIFTPDFIVKDMIKLIGNDNVANINATVLEPTSGDGAFTVRILELRLKKIFKKGICKSLFHYQHFSMKWMRTDDKTTCFHHVNVIC